jgi:hypothetical protein
MRFCPFCSAENADDLAVCQSCGRRLPPLPPRRARHAPATGVQLPPRSAGQPAAPARRAGTTNPPPPGATPATAGSAAALGVAPTVLTPAVPPPAALVAPPLATAPTITAPAVPPPPPTAGSKAAAVVLGTAPTITAPAVPPAPGPGLPPLAAAPALAASAALASAPLAPPVSVPAAAPPATAVPPAQPGVMVTSAGFAPLAVGPSGLRAPASASPAAGAASPIRETSTGLPPAPVSETPGGTLVALPDPAGQNRRRAEPAPPRPMPSVLGSGARAAPSGPASAGPADRGSPSSPRLVPPPPAVPAAPPPMPAGPGSADPPWASGYPRAPAGFGTASDGAPGAALTIDSARRRDDGIEPPPTRIQRPEALVDRPFAPPKVSPIPEIPEPGLYHSARYTVRFARARWQRRGAIKLLGADIKKDTDALDQVLGALGGVARTAKVDGRVFFGENAAINTAEERVAQLTREHNDVDARKAEENSKFVDVERERNTKLAEAERMVDEAQKELAGLEAQRRGLRDKRKELERRQKAYLKAAEDSDKQGGNAELGDARQEHRRTAEQNRREAAALEPERQDVDRRLAGIERPISEATARLDAAKAELDAAKRSLADAREGHIHRLAELDAEQKRKGREIAQAEGEIARRLVTLGTLVNLNRIEDPRFEELYQRIDRLRGAITARTTEIERLTAEREAYDRGNLVRGLAAIGGAILVFILLIVILRAVLR